MEGDDVILITGLEFYGYHGVSDEEQSVGQRYRVDLQLDADTRPAAASDRVEDTVDYAAVAASVMSIGTGARYRLLETLAQHMIDRIFAEYDGVSCVELRIEKLLPPMNAIVQSVGVKIRRSRP